MKTLEKDIILICKGHYDDKYKNGLEAFNAYYQKYGCEDINMDYKFALNLFIKPTIEFLLTQDNIRNFIYNGLFEKSHEEKRFMNENGCTEFYEVLYHRMIKWICLLQIKERNEETNKYEWLIDLSEYDMEENII